MTTSHLTPFPCDSCGKCCSNVHLSELTQELDRGDGICRHFDDSSLLCRIYDIRPDICRVELQYRNNYAHIYNWNEFVDLNLQVCKSLK